MFKKNGIFYGLFSRAIVLMLLLLLSACGAIDESEYEKSNESTYDSITSDSESTMRSEESTIDIWATTSENPTSDDYGSKTTTASDDETAAEEDSASKEETTTVPTTEVETTTKVETTTEAPKKDYKYAIRVNVSTNCVTIYTKDEKGEYTVPYKAMICSTGREGRTPLGSYNIIEFYKWCRMVDWTYGQYAYRIKGGIMFHSTPCALNLTVNGGSATPTYSYGRVEVDEYNKLGTSASLGCIRLTVADAKWICDNCPKGTLTTIVSEETDPLPRPEAIKIPENIPTECGGYVDTVMPENYKASPINWVIKRIYVAWDPTDPNPNNPWNKYSTTITCENEITVYSGCNFSDVLANIMVKDTCGNIINEKLIIVGEYNLEISGQYKLVLSATDALGRTAKKEIILTVKEAETSVENTTTTEIETTI